MPDRLDPPLGPGDHVQGPAGAPLELVIYGDFQCPFCTAAQPISRASASGSTGGCGSASGTSRCASAIPTPSVPREASEAAAAQDAFWPMHDALYGLRGRLGLEDILGAARGIGLDADRIRADLDAGSYAERVRRDVESALATGVGGTRPSSSVAGATRARSTSSR